MDSLRADFYMEQSLCERLYGRRPLTPDEEVFVLDLLVTVAQRPDLTESQRTTLWRAADCLHVGWMKGWTSMPQRPGDGVAYLVKCYVPPADADGWARCVDQAELFARMLGEAATYLRSFKASVDGIQPLTGWLETCCLCLSCGAHDLRLGAAGSGTQDLSRSDSIEMA